MLTARAPSRWSVNFFRGMIDDIKRRAPYYWSDWKDAWDYRVVPATVYMYFAKQVVPTQLLASSDLTCVPLFHVISHLNQPPTPLTFMHLFPWRFYHHHCAVVKRLPSTA